MLDDRLEQQPQLWIAIPAGLVAAVVEMVFVLPIQAVLGASPLVVFQSIAAGTLGRAAFSGGLGSATLGVAFHVLISLVAAFVFVLAARRWPALSRRAAWSGMAYGIPVFLFMTFVVVPSSAIGFHAPRSALLVLLSLAVHVFAFGLPIAVTTRWLAMKNDRVVAGHTPS